MAQKAQKIDNVKVKRGRLVRVANQKPHRNAKAVYTSIWIEDAKGKNEECLLFTEKELEVARQRALKNKEDLPKKDFLTDLLD